MKYCPKCNQNKENSDFYKCRSKKDGLQSYCKTCANENTKKWFKTPKGRIAQKRTNSSTSARESQQRYSRSKKGKAKAKKHYQTQKYRKAHVKANLAYRKRNPLIQKAHATVQNEVVTRRWQKVSFWLCRVCFKNDAKYYHHYNGYEPENWLKVFPVCIPCHRTIHSSQNNPQSSE